MKLRSSSLLLTSSLAFPVLAQTWCIPVVDVPGSFGSGIVNVTLFASPMIDRDSPVTEGYVNTGVGTTLTIGANYILTIDKSNGTFCANNNIAVYIDFNIDHDFNDPGETVVLAGNTGQGMSTYSFTVPTTALAGTTRMRVCEKMSSTLCGHTPINPCGTGDPLNYHGEIEDYTITLTGVSSVPDLFAASHVSFIVRDREVDLSIELLASAAVSIRVADLSGRLVVASELGMLSSGRNTGRVARLDRAGVYLAVVQVNGMQRSFRLLVE